MLSPIKPLARDVLRFVRTPTLSRSVIGLMSLALVLLLAVNAATYVMIQRTARYNDSVERTQQLRLKGKDLLNLLVDAETGQRGFLLTGRPSYLEIHNAARAAMPATQAELEALAADNPELTPRIKHMKELMDERLALLDSTIDLARAGRIGEAVQVLRSDVGKALMDGVREDLAAIDALEAQRLEYRTRRSERAGDTTIAVNAMAVVLVFLLAGITVWLVWRYIDEIMQAREAVHRLNEGLEEEVEARTADLTRANEEIQRFAYIVSHDLRAPLVNVMGYTSELEQAGAALSRQLERIEAEAPDILETEAVVAVREDIPEAIGFIRASTTKMDRLINAILKLSRDGRRNLTIERLDMTALAQNIADSVRHQTDEVGAEIIVGQLPSLDSDRLSMEQILGNLIDNAVKYLEPSRPGRIEVTGEVLRGEWVIFRVEDNGRGVAAKDHERIFELFRRSGRQDKVGEGVGLAFVRNIVRRLGGVITVESEIDRGSTFLLKFPKRLASTEAGDLT